MRMTMEGAIVESELERNEYEVAGRCSQPCWMSDSSFTFSYSSYLVEVRSKNFWVEKSEEFLMISFFT